MIGCIKYTSVSKKLILKTIALAVWRLFDKKRRAWNSLFQPPTKMMNKIGTRFGLWLCNTKKGTQSNYPNYANFRPKSLFPAKVHKRWTVHANYWDLGAGTPTEILKRRAFLWDFFVFGTAGLKCAKIGNQKYRNFRTKTQLLVFSTCLAKLFSSNNFC